MASQPQASPSPPLCGKLQKKPMLTLTIPRRGKDIKNKKKEKKGMKLIPSYRREVGKGPTNNEREAEGNRR